MEQMTIDCSGQTIPVTLANTVIVGAGASAMCCADKLVEFWTHRGVDDPAGRVVVVTAGMELGASRMSGSDKQTYYKMGTSPTVPDTAEDFARTLMSFGCCHGDTALAEGIGSLRGFYSLVEAGVPFPHDSDGAFIGYKTDHDPYERATSAGPKTSRFMSECLQARLERRGVKMFDRRPVGRICMVGEGENRRVVAIACFTPEGGVELFVARHWVFAAGGPGELFQDSVYPRGQYGMFGAALEAGLEACNLTEGQFGLASTKFRWNVSGTYMQVIPRIFSTDADGNDEREFLTEYFPDMATMATNIFLKGYQWPFDSQRIVDHQSSLIDMAVHQETIVRGRRVYMDFLQNPIGEDGWRDFSLEELGEEAMEYLQKTGADQPLPIDRLKHMNPPAIEIYAENGIDLMAEPLEIAVCAQHLNGGFSIDSWWRSNIPGVFIIGEMAGSHGVKRPGGSALNAGQVGATRAAEQIACASSADLPDWQSEHETVEGSLGSFMAELSRLLEQDGSAGVSPNEAMDTIRDRMTRFGAQLRSRQGASQALAEAVKQYRGMLQGGLKVRVPGDLPRAVRVRLQCLAHAAMLKAICAMFDRGAGSRGSHCILDPSGEPMHPKLLDPGTGESYRFLPENEALRDEIITLRYDESADDLFSVRIDPPRPLPRRDLAFETAWSEYRDGRVYRKDT